MRFARCGSCTGLLLATPTTRGSGMSILAAACACACSCACTCVCVCVVAAPPRDGVSIGNAEAPTRRAGCVEPAGAKPYIPTKPRER